MFNKKRIIAVLLFLLLSFFMITFANPAENEAKATRTVTFIDSYDNKQLDKKTVEVGTKVTAPEVPDHKNVVFIGWYKEDTNEKANLDNITENITVKTKYADDINNNGIADDDDTYYTVRFIDSRKDTTLKSQRVLTGMSATAPTVPSYEGYTFNGWTRRYGEVTSNIDTETIYLATNYTITFDTDGGTAVPKIVGNIGIAVTKPVDPTKEGYTFAGWDQEIPEVMPAKNMEIKAIWEINEYTITFMDGETVISTITQNYGTAVAAPADLIKEGYKFNWDQVVPTTMPAKDMTINAVWEINEYTITFMDGEKIINKITQNYGTAVTLPADPIKEGYTFKNWDQVIPTTMPAANMTINAVWEINSYTIVFDSNGGSAVTSLVLEYNAEIDLSGITSTMEGYTFKGWEPKELTEMPTTMPETGFEVIAIWEINEYTVTFMDGETVVSTIKQDYGTAITAPASLTKEGYTFSWDQEIPTAMPAKDMTINAVWTPIKYAIIFDTDGGETIEPLYQDYNSVIDLSVVEPTKEGYKFKRWEPKVLTEMPTTMPLGGFEVIAIWEINEYTITFMDGETVVSTIKQDYGTAITAPADPTKENYNFAGWDQIVPSTMPATDMTINALWTPVPSTRTLTVEVEEGDLKKHTVKATEGSCNKTDGSGNCISDTSTDNDKKKTYIVSNNATIRISEIAKKNNHKLKVEVIIDGETTTIYPKKHDDKYSFNINAITKDVTVKISWETK